VRYRLRRLAEGAVDGRAEKSVRAEPWAGAIEHWMQSTAARERGVNLQVLYEWLVAEHGYAGSYKAIQRRDRCCGGPERTATDLSPPTGLRGDFP
jgi:hypothetical protein